MKWILLVIVLGLGGCTANVEIGLPTAETTTTTSTTPTTTTTSTTTTTTTSTPTTTTTTTTQAGGTTTSSTTTTQAEATTTTTTPTTTTTTSTTTTTTTTTTTVFSLSSSAFSSGAKIPAAHANTGQGIPGAMNTSIPLSWSGAPAATQSFALLMYDPDADNFIHWAVINLPIATSALASGISSAVMPAGSSQLNNSSNIAGYEGPWPPAGSTHTYYIMLYALTGTVDGGSISSPVTRTSWDSVITPLNIQGVTLTGTFSW